MSRNVILGTAGHIDHGKSSLVKALTGTDPDRLKEEKERGITIDLGFAELAYPDGVNIGIVDVPGHERLIRNMLAGAGGIDMVVLVIAADEGVMPQSREHLSICNLLGIQRGLVALTKIDLVEEDWVELVSEDVRGFLRGSFLEGGEIIPVSAKTGANLESLRKALHAMASQVPLKSQKGVFRLPIDRVFTLKGFGTVVTGTALDGRVSVDEMVEILPSGRTSRVRSLQSHGHSLTTAVAGQRVAVNLQGIEKNEIVRGDVLTVPGKLRGTRVIDGQIRLLKDAPALKNRDQIHFHVGTAETVARVVLYEVDPLKPGGQAFCQLRLEAPVVTMAGDRFVVRRLSPLVTMGGGVVLDPSPRRRRRADGISDLEVFASGPLQDSIETKVRREGIYGISMGRLEGWIRGDVPDMVAAV
ncbi:MAG: selenocysteine-specific translation elongation factor, partial [Thermodesulfobacteriota bacterium]